MGHPQEQQQRTVFCVYFPSHQSCDRNKSKQGLCVHGCAYVHGCECTWACACVCLTLHLCLDLSPWGKPCPVSSCGDTHVVRT